MVSAIHPTHTLRQERGFRIFDERIVFMRESEQNRMAFSFSASVISEMIVVVASVVVAFWINAELAFLALGSVVLLYMTLRHMILDKGG
jgi:hypothetical protein